MPRHTKSQAILNAMSSAIDLPAGAYTWSGNLEVRRLDEDGLKIALFHNHEYLASMEHRNGFHRWTISRIGGQFSKAEQRRFASPSIVSTPWTASYTVGE
jgi:hypothetical protein